MYVVLLDVMSCHQHYHQSLTLPDASALHPPGAVLLSPGRQSGQDDHSCSLWDQELSRRRRPRDSVLCRPPGLDPLRLEGSGWGEVLSAEAGGRE